MARMKHLRPSRLLIPVALLAASATWAALPAGAIIVGDPPTVDASVACDTATGHQVVTWTFHNGSGSAVTIDSSVLVLGALVEAPIDTTVSFSPTSVDVSADATATTQVDGSDTGVIGVSVDYTYQLQDPTVATRITLPGGCQVAASSTTSTTTAVAPTTTVPVPVAPATAVQARPTYTG